MATSTSLPHRKVVQARALLWAGEGTSNQEIARRSGVDSDAVRRWRTRFAEKGVEGVGVIAKGRGRKPSLPAGTVAEVLRLTQHEKPDDGSTHWTTRRLAAKVGIGKDAVARIWNDHNLKPWQVEAFKISNDPRFEEKLVDVVGLYMNPPKRAVVFSFDEKTQCQALDRTQPRLPLRPGRAGTMTRWHLHFTPPPAPGSISSSPGSKNCSIGGYAGASSPASPISSQRSSCGRLTGTWTPSPSYGTNPRPRSSRRCAAAVPPSTRSNQRWTTR
jgi:transposase